MPEPLTPDPAMGERWNEKLAAFKEAADSGDLELQELLFRELIDIAISRYGLQDSYQDLEASRNILKRLEEEWSESDHFFSSTASCHAGTWEAGLYLRRPSELLHLISEQAEVVAAKEEIRSEALDSLETDLLYALQEIDAMPLEDEMPVEMTLSPLAASLFGDIFKSLSDLERAQKYYNVAAINPMQTATGAVWYRIRALEIDLHSEDEAKIKKAVEEIEALRAGLTDLLFSVYDEQIMEEATAGLSDGAMGINLEGETPRIPAGTEEQIHEIDALAWGVLYDAYAQLADEKKLQEMEEERRQIVRGRIGKVSPLEAVLHVDNMDRVALFKTVHRGLIEQALRSNGQEAARNAQRQLIDDLNGIYRLIDPHMERRAGDPLFEGFARLNWKVFFGGYVARDLPQTALYYLNDFVIKPSAVNQSYLSDNLSGQRCNDYSSIDCIDTPEYEPADMIAENEYEVSGNALDNDWDSSFDSPTPNEYYDRSAGRLNGLAPWFYDEEGRVAGFGDSQFIADQLNLLRGQAPQIFTAEGRLNPNVNAGDTETADRVMTAYWRSNDTLREVGLPMGGAVACFAIAAAFAETLIVPAIAAAVCGAGGSLINRETNEANASEQYWQARATGIAQITPREAAGNKGVWYFTEGLNTVFNAAMIAPMASIWGRAGLRALTAGAARGGAWLATETGGRALLQMASKPWQLAGRALSSMGNAAATVGRWYWKLPVGTRLRLAGLLPAAADYGFIDKEGDLVSWDGELNHWYGYAGLASLASEGGYQIFSRAWRPSFAQIISASPIRNGAIRLGADMAAADYYLVQKDENGEYAFVDFDAARATSLEEHAFESQFGIDTWLGGAGLMLASGDWLQSEIGAMGWLERGLLVSGTGGVLYDVVDDGHLNSAAGGIGGSMVSAELCYRAMNVNAVGSMAFLPFRILGEWTVQAMQDVPIQTPDPQRLISSTVESAFMLMVVKGLYQGNHYWNTFPLGKNIALAASDAPVLRHLRSIQNLGRFSFFGGNRPSLDGWSQGIKVQPLKNMGNGTTLYRLRGDKHWNGLGKGNADVNLQVVRGANGAAARFFIGEAEVGESFLLEHGYVFRNNTLLEFKPLRNGYIYLGGKKMTAQQIRNLNDGARARAIGELRQSGWYLRENHFERYWIERPYHPEVLMTEPAGRWSTPDYKIVQSSITTNGNTIPVWLKFSRRAITADEVMVGGRRISTWTGLREMPRFTPWGVAIQGPPVIGSAYASNYLIFHHVARGDPDYQPMSRIALYVPTVYFTWPVVQAPLGLDTAQARLTGTMFGQFFLMGSAWLYPPYRNTAPGQETLYDLLDAGGSIDRPWYHPNSDNAFDSFGRIITSGSPGFWGPVQGSFYEIEEPAMDNLRVGLDCRMDMAQGTALGDSDACVLLPNATKSQIQMLEHDLNLEVMKKRLDAWATLFEDKMEQERTGDLTERDRRLVIMLGAWFKYMLRNDERYEPTAPDGSRYPTLENIRRVYQHGGYSWFFDMVPTLTTDSEWSDYISQVNGGRARASDFYFDPHLD